MKEKLIEIAKEKHGVEITPCGGHSSFDTCFTTHEGELIFWYNKPCGSTAIIKESVLN